MEKKFSLEAGKKKKKKSKELKSLKFPKNLLELLCSLIITVFTDISAVIPIFCISIRSLNHFYRGITKSIKDFS